MGRRLFTTLAAAALAMAGQHAEAGALTYDAGIVTGATGVSVDGSLYDARFVDGTCVGLFSGCDSNAGASFTFTTFTDAQNASQALIDQVFAGNPDPGTISGCADAHQTNASTVCSILIPYATGLPFVFFSGPVVFRGTQLVNGDAIDANADTTTDRTAVYAVFSAAQTAIPEPLSGAVLLAGVAGAIATRRKRRKT